MVDGSPWFKAKEVASVLGYTRTMKAIIDHMDAED
ncbi:MAG: Bro-N domain-containing protein [Candidatus Fonsibacter sp.]